MRVFAIIVFVATAVWFASCLANIYEANSPPFAIEEKP